MPVGGTPVEGGTTDYTARPERDAVEERAVHFGR